MNHERLERTLRKNRKQFKRRTGIYPETFVAMEAVLIEREASKKKSGRPAALSPGSQLLLTLEFWREYRTYAHLGDDWGIHETTVQRTVERVEATLVASEQFQLPGKKVLKDAETVFEMIAVDASYGFRLIPYVFESRPPMKESMGTDQVWPMFQSSALSSEGALQVAQGREVFVLQADISERPEPFDRLQFW